mmetsp:Transcript_22072/g.63162  ORF Transcript_22072/g.63162 Transcript_22072/m.63162 type:complete len:203 (-) Transcript_22072:150-758(-)
MCLARRRDSSERNFSSWKSTVMSSSIGKARLSHFWKRRLMDLPITIPALPDGELYSDTLSFIRVRARFLLPLRETGGLAPLSSEAESSMGSEGLEIWRRGFRPSRIRLCCGGGSLTGITCRAQLSVWTVSGSSPSPQSSSSSSPNSSVSWGTKHISTPATATFSAASLAVGKIMRSKWCRAMISQPCLTMLRTAFVAASSAQ